MPFWDGGAESPPTSSAARMVVDPGKILQLKKRLEDDFWDDTPPVARAVIGDEDDE